MSTKFSRKTFLKGSVAGLGMMALNVCTGRGSLCCRARSRRSGGYQLPEPRP